MHARVPPRARAVHAAAGEPGGVPSECDAACERAGFALADWHRALGEVDRVEALLLETLDALELVELAATIPGVSPVGVAAILAQTGDPARYDSARTWVKHAGLCPRDNESGTFAGSTTISRRGRPALRTAAWRAVWSALQHNPVYRARYQHLTTRAGNPLRDGQARTAIAAALLRQLFIVVTRRVAWDPDIAAGRAHELTDATVAPMAA